jgi:2-phosphoglycerate kinase
MNDDLKVLLVGGSSGVGKTVVAPQLAAQLGMTWASADDFRLVVERITTPDTHPALHMFFRTLTQRWPAELAHAYIEVGRVVYDALEIVIANHVATDPPFLLEGDTIFPELAVKRVVANLPLGNYGRAVFLFEPDEVVIRHNVLKRGRGVAQLTPEQLTSHVRFSWLYGQWLQREAGAHGLLVITVRPRETLVARILELLQSHLPR